MPTNHGRRKAALLRQILAAENELNTGLEQPTNLDEFEENLPEELESSDLSFLDDAEATAGSEEDEMIDVTDIVACSDENGKVRMSSIRALASCQVPDDMGDNEILKGSRTADIHRPGPEDNIGDQQSGGQPSMSEVTPGGEGQTMSYEDQKNEIKSITAAVDRLAGYCQRSGNKKLAYRLDLVSNTLDQINGGK